MPSEPGTSAVIVHDVIGAETYTDRKGISHPNKKGSRSLYFANKLEDQFIGLLGDYYQPLINDSAHFIETSLPVNTLLVNQPKIVDKDPIPPNFLIGDYAGLIMIDFEKLTLMPIQIGLVKLLEYGSSDYLGSSEKEKIIGHAASLLERRANTKLDRHEFLSVYYAASAFVHLTLTGYITPFLFRENIADTKKISSERSAHFGNALGSLESLIVRTTHVEDCRSLQEMYALAEGIQKTIDSSDSARS